MSLIVPLAALPKHLDYLVGAWQTPVTLKLFQNDLTPDADTVLGDFVEADFTGYTSKNASALGFSAAAVVPPRALVSSGPFTWTVGNPVITGNYVFGYYVIDGFGDLLWCERPASGPAPMNLPALQLVMYLQFSDQSLF